MGKRLVTITYTAAAIAIFLPLEAFASTSADFGGSEIIAQASKIQAFLFGPTMRVVGVIGGAYGLIQAILSSSLKPLIIFGGIGLAVNIIPKFIDGIYGVSGMMLP